ncbi:MAG: extracellular solute-binding protein [Hyphomicrobiaceae bacterium]|nr:extracellular solute-binding protein [Hyphomicrobiaceae bacterium]
MVAKGSAAVLGTLIAVTAVLAAPPARAQHAATAPSPSPTAATQPTPDTPTTGTAAPALAATPTTSSPPVQPPRPTSITIATWDGAYGAAQQAAVLGPFAQEHAIEVKSVPALRNRLPDRADVVEIDAATLEAACASGQLVPIEPSALHPGSGGTDAREDFLPGMLTRCGVGNVAWSAVIAVNRQAFATRAPKTLADAFDTKRFSGKRAFVREPRHLLEATLLADGVDGTEVYRLLETDAGLDRALGRLDRIFRDILWVDDAKGAMEAVEKGNAAVGQVFSGRAFLSAARGSGIELVWDGQLYSVNFLAISAGSEAKDVALDLVSFATSPERLAAFAQQLPYGPVRLSALALTRSHAVADVPLEPFLPTSPANLTRAVAFDPVWWARHGEKIAVRFRVWLAEGENAAKAHQSGESPPPLPQPKPR